MSIALSSLLAVATLANRHSVYELHQLQTAASKKKAAKGGTHGAKQPLPALQRYAEAELDSSDEEMAALLALGEQGM